MDDWAIKEDLRTQNEKRKQEQQAEQQKFYHQNSELLRNGNYEVILAPAKAYLKCLVISIVNPRLTNVLQHG